MRDFRLSGVVMAGIVCPGAPPSSVWGLVAILVGMIRACALFVNGAYSRTPCIRLGMSALSAFVWAQVVIGLMLVPNMGLIVYSWLVVIDLVSAYRAAMDAAIAERNRKYSRLGAVNSERSVRHLTSRTVG